MQNNIKITNFNSYTTLIKEVIAFVISPNNKSKNLSVTEKLKSLILLFILKFTFTLLLIFIIRLFIDNENIALIKLKSNLSPFLLFLIGVLLVPFIEEIIFRLSLIFKPIFLSLACSLLFYIVLSKFYFKTNYLFLDSTLLLRLVLALIIGILVFTITSKFYNQLTIFWNNNFKWIYYISVIVFGFFHILNYQIGPQDFIIVPLLVLPQLLGGVILGFIRIKYGFVYCCIFHSCFNVLPMLI